MGKTRCINCMKMIDEETFFCPHCGCGQKEETSPFGLKPGTILRGRYLVGKMLGQGGFGLTYVGYDLTLEIKTAIKEYFPSGLATRNSTVSNQVQRNSSQLDQKSWQAGCESFLKEARRMAKIDSLPGIVRVRDTFPENQTAYIVMDFIEGETLKQRLAKTGPMRAAECLRLLRPLMESLGKVHGHGLVHRDISPDNIMVQPDGSVCLLDFGAAKDISLQNAASQQIAKKGFSPPEQYREKGSIGPWTDVYALCATIYYCITGKLVPDAMDRIYGEELDFNVPMREPLQAGTAQTLEDGLKLRPEERIRTVEELLGRFEGTETGRDREDTETGGTGREADSRENLKEAGEASPKNKEEPQGGSGVLPKTGEKTPESREKTWDSAVKKQTAQDSGTEVQKRKRSKKTAVMVAAATAALVLLVIKLIPDSGGKDVVRSAVVSDQAAAELPDDTGQPESRETADDAGDTEMLPTDGKLEDSEFFYMLMADNTCEVSHDDYGDFLQHGTVLGSEISRDRIAAVQFVDSLDEAADGAWDVSEGQDGTVMAWTTPNASDDRLLDLWIGAEGKIAAADCSGLFEGYYNVEAIDFNGCFDTGRTTNMEDMFNNCEKLVRLDVSGFDTGHVADMGGMFDHCSSLTQLDVSGFDTGRVTNMEDMFSNCNKVAQLDVSSFDTGRVTDMDGMFWECYELTELDVSSFDTSQVTSMSVMFALCEGLAQLDVSGFDTGKVVNMSAMFANCACLTQLDVSSFDTGQVTVMEGMFSGCESLTQLDLSGFDMSQVTSMEAMFDGCGITAEEAGLKTE